MDKKTLDKVSELVAFDFIPKAKEKESFEDFVKRAYPEFDKAVSKSNNPVISEIASDSKNPVNNAIGRLSVRTAIVERFCNANDAFAMEAPKDATNDEILKLNGIPAGEKELRKVMGDEGFENYIAKLKKPAKDGLTQTAIREAREKHYAKYEPCFPSEKKYSHGSGGTTRGYHWQSSLQDEYVKDHNLFLKTYGLEDQFVVIEEPAKEAEKEPVAETA